MGHPSPMVLGAEKPALRGNIALPAAGGLTSCHAQRHPRRHATAKTVDGL